MTLPFVEMPFIGYDLLIINKQALGRAKDMDDILQLQLKHDRRLPQTRQRKRPR